MTEDNNTTPPPVTDDLSQFVPMANYQAVSDKVQKLESDLEAAKAHRNQMIAKLGEWESIILDWVTEYPHSREELAQALGLDEPEWVVRFAATLYVEGTVRVGAWDEDNANDKASEAVSDAWYSVTSDDVEDVDCLEVRSVDMGEVERDTL